MASTELLMDGDALLIRIPKERLNDILFVPTGRLRVVIETGTSRLVIHFTKPPKPCSHRIAELYSRPPPSAI